MGDKLAGRAECDGAVWMQGRSTVFEGLEAHGVAVERVAVAVDDEANCAKYISELRATWGKLVLEGFHC